jgi:hypothetical protein
MMEKSKRLTEVEIEQRRATLREWHRERDSDPEFLKMRTWLKEIFKSEDDALCGFAARQCLDVGDLAAENEKLVELLNRKRNHAGMLSNASLPAYVRQNIANSIREHYPNDESAFIYTQVIAKEQQASKRGRAAADALHSQPGGSRDKRQAMLNSWASGKYTTRDMCAEEECAGIGLSFSKARKHLIGTADNPKSQ